MTRRSGICADCGGITKVNTAVCCLKCLRIRQKAGTVLRRPITKKCPLCGNLNSLTFNQERIWQMKENLETVREIYEGERISLKHLRREKERWERKVGVARAFHDKTLGEVQKRLKEMKVTEEGIRQLLKKQIK